MRNDSPDEWSYVTNSVNSDQYLRFSQQASKKTKKTKVTGQHDPEKSAANEINIHDYLDDLCNTVYLLEKKKAKLIAKAQNVDLVNTLEVLTMETILRKVRVQHCINQLNSIIDGTHEMSACKSKSEQSLECQDKSDLDSDLYELSRMPVELEVLESDGSNRSGNIKSTKLEEHELLEKVGKISAFRIGEQGSEQTLRFCFFRLNDEESDDYELLFGVGTNETWSDDYEYGLVIGECTKDCDKYRFSYKKEGVFFDTIGVPEDPIEIAPYKEIPVEEKTLLNVLISSTKSIACISTKVTPLLGNFLQCFQIRNKNRSAIFQDVEFCLSRGEFEVLLRRLPIDELEISLHSARLPNTIPPLDDKMALLLPSRFCINVDKLTACIGLTDVTIRNWYHKVPQRLELHNVKGSFTVEAICKLVETALTSRTVPSDHFVWCFTLSAVDRSTLKSYVESTFLTQFEDREAIKISDKATGRTMRLLLYKLEYGIELQAYREAKIKDFHNRCRNGTATKFPPFEWENPYPSPYDKFM